MGGGRMMGPMGIQGGPGQFGMGGRMPSQMMPRSGVMNSPGNMMPGPISTSGMMQQMASSPGMMTSAQGMTSSMSQNTIPMATTSINSNNMGVGGPMPNQPQDGTQPGMGSTATDGGNDTTTTPNPTPPPTTGKTTPTPQATSQNKEVNTSTVCRIGQETVEEIVSRTQEVFSILKSLMPPIGASSTQSLDRGTLEKQNRLQEVLKGIGMLFKRLRVCWDKCQENTAGMEFIAIESLVPVKDDMGDSGRTELEKKRGDAYRTASEEHNELIQQITMKNRHLKDIIDQMRNIIWEINTMLAMRRS